MDGLNRFKIGLKSFSLDMDRPIKYDRTVQLRVPIHKNMNQSETLSKRIGLNHKLLIFLFLKLFKINILNFF